MSFLDQLNPQQREAVETTDGPVLILAGAGSGKTRVITYRIAYLIENLGVMPESILAMTFTNKAASEMVERVDKLVGGLSIAKPVISTFHSFCVRVLRRDIEALRIPSSVPGAPAIGHTKSFVIYDENDQQQLVKSVMRRLGIDDKQTTPRSVLAHISWAKNHMLDPQEVYLQSADPKTERVAQIYAEYKKELAKANALDFDDLLLETVRLLKAAAEVREYYNRRFQYILVDEYQDTNRPQYELMRLLAGTRHNICAVGDEDQSIYSWRGADIRNILEFEKDFPEAKIIRLEQNYRSTQNILQAASAVVANNLKRKGKNLWTSRQGGTRLGYYEAPDGENEALFAADYIAKYLREAVDQGENVRAAVLYRTNSQSRLFEEAMRRYQLKYHVVGGFSFYERSEIKDMISYLKVIHNVDDSISLLRVINTPVRGIGKTTIETLERVALETGTSLWGALGEAIKRQLLPQRAIAALRSFKRLIEDGHAMLAGTYVERLEDTAREDQHADLATDESPEDADVTFDPSEDENISFDFGVPDEVDTSPETTGPAVAGEGARPTQAAEPGFRAPGEAANTAEILKFLIDRTGYIKQLEEEDTPEAYSRIENLRELVNAAMDSRDRGETLDQFLDHAALVSDADAYDERAQITLMTLHAAKGLEFSLVFLCGLEEGSVPAFSDFLAARRYRRRTAIVLCGHDAGDGYFGPDPSRVSSALRNGFARGQRAFEVSRKKYRQRWWRNWEVRDEKGKLHGQECPRHTNLSSRPTTLTRMKIRAARTGRLRASHRLLLILDAATIPLTILRSFSRRGERNLTSRKRWWKSPGARRVSSRARRCGIPNTAKGRCTIEKGRVKRPRLRYNSLASV